MKVKFILSVVVSFLSIYVSAQNKSIFKDSLDNKTDMSDWVLTAHGFIPVPSLITEPALGNIGGALFPVFISANSPFIDTINGKINIERVKPNIYGVGAAYTANKTWLVAGACMGVIKKWRVQYRLVSAYADVNIELYKTIDKIGEKSFNFNIETVPVYAQMIKQFKKRSPWHAGLNYLFLKTHFKRTSAEFYTPNEINKNISRLGVICEFDHRDNIFTPDKGFRWNTLIAASDKAIGSNYNYQTASSAAFQYIPFMPNLIGGFRLEYQQAWGDIPFYMIPFINMRGIPIARYQGKITTLGESELRWDFSSRYSLVGFAGAGKAFSEWSDFEDSNWHASGGAGFRYLIARKLKLRMGIDVAHGPEQWAYYMVFGTTWVR